MGRLVIDGNTVYEIDEECMENGKIQEKGDIKQNLRYRVQSELQKNKPQKDRNKN